jgi:hypothetical protein
LRAWRGRDAGHGEADTQGQHAPLAERVARLIGFLPGVYWGLFCIPFGPPRPRALTVVVGKPVPIPEDLPEGGSAEAVARYHRAFVDAMRALFEAHKAEMGMGHVSLRII